MADNTSEAFNEIKRLVRKHNLGELVNPGGREFIHPTAGSVTVADWDTQADLARLLAWLRQHGLED